MRRASFELLGVHGEAAHLVARRKRAPHLGWEFMWKTGIAEEDVVGKEGSQEIFELLGGALFYW